MDWPLIAKATGLIILGTLFAVGGRGYGALMVEKQAHYARERGENGSAETFGGKIIGWLATGWGVLVAVSGLVVLGAALLGLAPEEW